MGIAETNQRSLMAWGFSGHHDPIDAGTHLIEQVGQSLMGTRPTFAFLFASGYQATALDALGSRVGEALGINEIIGTTSTGIIGGRLTIENRPGVSLLVGAFPNARAKLVRLPAHAIPVEDDIDLQQWVVETLRVEPDNRATFLFADPSSLAISRMVPAILSAGKGVPVFGATPSVPVSEKKKGRNGLLFCGQGVQRGGLACLSVAGDIGVETILGQSCRPVGPAMVVTRSKRNLIRELGGKPAIQAIRDVAHSFDPEERRLLEGGLYIGLAIDEYRERFGRGDFVLRKVLGGHGPSGSIAIDEPVRPGRTVQVHLLDASLARSDLELLLDAQKLHERALGALILTDTARGKSLFKDEWSDAAAVSRAFDVRPGGEQKAKGGHEIAGLGGSIPAAGCASNGQIAPIGGTARVHQACAGVAFFRAGRRAGDSPPLG